MLQVQQTTTAHNLAEALKDEEGTFLARQGGQNFIVQSARGHSIVSGPTPVGPPIAGFVMQSVSAEPWSITKISERLENDQLGSQRRQT